MADGIRHLACDWKYVKYVRETEGAIAMSQSGADALWPHVSDLDWPDIVNVLDIVRLSTEGRDGIDLYIEMRTAGVPHFYIAEFPKVYIANEVETVASEIIGLYRSEVPSHYASILISSFDAAAICQLHRASVPSDYALDCSISGLDVDRVVAAHLAGLPLEYATA